MLFLHHSFSHAPFVFPSHTHTLNHTHGRVISTNLEEVERLNAHNYTSIQTYVSQSQMPSMCEMGVTPLEVSLFVKCVRVCLNTLDTTHQSQRLCNIPPLLIISGKAFACWVHRTPDPIPSYSPLIRQHMQKNRIAQSSGRSLVIEDGFNIPLDNKGFPCSWVRKMGQCASIFGKTLKKSSHFMSIKCFFITRPFPPWRLQVGW